MTAALNLVAREQTAAEILAEHNRSVAATKLVAKRFPDAKRRGSKWVSASVNAGNAKGVDFALVWSATEAVAARVDVYTTLRPKGGEPIRVYGSQSYKLTSAHIAGVLESNPKMLLVGLARVLEIQEAV